MTDTSNQKPADDDGRRSVGLIAASVFVGLLILVGGFVIATRDDDQDNPAATQPTPSSTPDPGASTATGFGPPEVDVFGRRVDIPNNPYGQPLNQTAAQRNPSDPDWLTAAPAGTRDRGGWQRVTGAVVPFSTSDGPTGIKDGLPTGYAHTPQGCALASVYIGYEVNARPGDRLLREHMVVTSAADMAKFDRDRAAGKIPDRAPETITRWMLAPDAYQVISWADDLCVIRFAAKNEPDKAGTPRWYAVQAAMVWDGSGWKLQPPRGGQPPQETVYSLAGWTQW